MKYRVRRVNQHTHPKAFVLEVFREKTRPWGKLARPARWVLVDYLDTSIPAEARRAAEQHTFAELERGYDEHDTVLHTFEVK